MGLRVVVKGALLVNELVRTPKLDGVLAFCEPIGVPKSEVLPIRGDSGI